jgi:hypothetical protein
LITENGYFSPSVGSVASLFLHRSGNMIGQEGYVKITGENSLIGLILTDALRLYFKIICKVYPCCGISSTYVLNHLMTDEFVIGIKWTQGYVHKILYNSS